MMIALRHEALETRWASAIVAVIEASGIGIEHNSEVGYQATHPQAQTIVDDEAAWLPRAKADQCDAVDALYADRIGDGFRYRGYVFQIDPASMHHIAMAAMFTEGASDWIAADNTLLPFATGADMTAFAHAAWAYVSGLAMARRRIKDAVQAAPSAAALGEIDITQGWPAN